MSYVACNGYQDPHKKISLVRYDSHVASESIGTFPISSPGSTSQSKPDHSVLDIENAHKPSGLDGLEGVVNDIAYRFLGLW
jgi:hypothetical protein